VTKLFLGKYCGDRIRPTVESVSRAENSSERTSTDRN
jgi:hypothetical protein